jgi:hypothetical protein
MPGYRWPSIAVATTEDTLPPFELEVGFRLRSGALNYGDRLPTNRWLASGRGFVAAIRGGGDAAYRYAIVPANSDPILILPTPPRPSFPQWYDEPWVRGAVPHPRNRDLISLGRTHLYDVTRGRMFSARITSLSGPDHLDPWSAADQEMVFALPHGGHGGVGTPVMLAPKFEKPPFDDTFRMVVEVDPTGLNLRGAPALQAESFRVLHDGDLVTLAESPDPSLDASERSVKDFDGIRWMYVRHEEDGLAGWVNSAWLAWA